MTARTKKGSLGRASGRVAAALSVLSLALSCQSEGGDPTGGETHFLATCEPSSGSCGAELLCVCGLCTLPCDAESACGALPGAVCRVSDAEACTEARCDVPCVADADCAALSASHRCEAGYCRSATSGSVSTGGSSGAGGSGGLGGSSGAGGDGGAGGAIPVECAPVEATGDQVVLLGDTFFASTHRITAHLEDLARQAGALPADASYRDHSNLTGNALALGGNGIASQYAAALEEGEVKLVVMNGGGADALLAPCEADDTACPALPAAASALNELFQSMEADGVFAVFYAFYPDPVDATVRARMDLLRPLIEAECAISPVPCRWLDLRDTFAGHYTEYVLEDGFNPTDAGSLAVAEVIWSAMQELCVTP